MPILTSAAIIAASRSTPLRDRFVALGATLDPPMTQGEVDVAMTRLAAAPVNGSSDTVGSVFEYASAVRAQAVAALPPDPGADPAQLLDSHLVHALQHVRAQGA